MCMSSNECMFGPLFLAYDVLSIAHTGRPGPRLGRLLAASSDVHAEACTGRRSAPIGHSCRVYRSPASTRLVRCPVRPTPRQLGRVDDALAVNRIVGQNGIEDSGLLEHVKGVRAYDDGVPGPSAAQMWVADVEEASIASCRACRTAYSRSLLAGRWTDAGGDLQGHTGEGRHRSWPRRPAQAYTPGASCLVRWTYST